MLDDLLDLIFRGGLNGTAGATEDSSFQAPAIFGFMSVFCGVCALAFTDTTSVVFTVIGLLTGSVAIWTLAQAFRN